HYRVEECVGCWGVLACIVYFLFFFFQEEDGIRDKLVTGVQTCALPIYTNIRPLIRCTRRSPATPVPYSFQQRQRAKMLGSNARLGTVPCQVSQSRVRGERSGGGGYCHAPVGSLRPSHPSTSIRSPSVPCAISSLALAQIWELTRCEPICTMRPVFFAASTMATPSAGLCDIGFSQ